MKKSLYAVVLAVTVTVWAGFGVTHAEHQDHGVAANTEGSQIGAFVDRVLSSNAAFMKKHKAKYFSAFKESQHPKATVVSCSDSRVHMHAIDSTPDNELFVIRNIGNQLATAEGSVEYGIHHLHTPVLLIMGHVRCGAIKAASGDYSTESPSIRRELDTIKIDKNDTWLAGVRTNVNNQVAEAMKKFDHEVKDGSLLVVGAVYDFADDMKQGSGRLSVINVNGDTGPATIAAFTAEHTKKTVKHAKHTKKKEAA